MKVIPVVFALIIAVTTGVWDVLLRTLVYISKNRFPYLIPAIQDPSGQVFPIMSPYFKKRSVFAAFMFAAFSGFVAITAVLLFSFVFCDRFGFQPGVRWSYILWIAFISGVIGLIMKYTNYAPPLAQTYYSQATFRTFLLDSLSGVMVALPVLLVVQPRETECDADGD